MKTKDTTFENLALADEAVDVIRSGVTQIKDLTEALQVKRRRLIRVLESDPRFIRGENGAWSLNNRMKAVRERKEELAEA